MWHINLKVYWDNEKSLPKAKQSNKNFGRNKEKSIEVLRHIRPAIQNPTFIYHIAGCNDGERFPDICIWV